MKFSIEGNECMPPVSGGCLIIMLDREAMQVVSVPSPNLFADRYRHSISENSDTFKDAAGNEFSISVWSSNAGVDWQLDVTSNDDAEGLKHRIGVEYKPNEF